jgi:hypothetical protein
LSNLSPNLEMSASRGKGSQDRVTPAALAVSLSAAEKGLDDGESEAMTTDPASTYRGYLLPHLDRIRQMHTDGADTRAIAEELYKLGARANTTDPNIPRMWRRLCGWS